MEQLFNEQRQAPTPTGKMPGQPEFDEEMPTEDEQKQYDQFVNRALDFMGQKPEPLVATMNDKNKPVHENVGELAVKIGKMVMGSAKAAKQEITPDVIHAAGQEIVEHLMELGDAAGIFPFNMESDEFEQEQAMSFAHAANIAANELMESPEYTPEMQEEAGNFMAQGVAREVQSGESPGHKLPEPERAMTKPKKITTSGKPGDSGPGGAHPGRNQGV